MTEQKPLMLWDSIEGDFDCACGESHYVEDCMLPATVVCPSCGQVWRIDFNITQDTPPPAEGRGR